MFVVDAAFSDKIVLEPLQNWKRTISIRNLRPNEVIKDDRIPTLLRELNQPTFLTFDESGFWKRRLCDPRYSIVCFAINKNQQELVVNLLRKLLKRPEFKTQKNRMGKVVRVSQANIKYYKFAEMKMQTLRWSQK